MGIVYVLVGLITIVIGFCEYIFLISEHNSIRKIIFFAIIQFASIILLATMTYKITVANGKDTQTIIDTGNYNKHIGEQNILLSRQIKKLQGLDDLITRHSDSLTKKIDTITNASNKIISAVDSVIKEQSEENALTGYFSFDVGKPLYGSDTLTLQFGGMTHTNTILPDPKVWYKSGINLIVFQDGFKPIKFDLVKHKLVVSVDVYDLSGNLIVKIDKNYWHRYTNNTGIFNYDKSGFEIFDNRGNIALSMDFSSKKINIQGYLIERKYNAIIIAGQEAIVPGQWGDQNTEEILMNAVSKVKVRQLFKYTGIHWLHQRM